MENLQQTFQITSIWLWALAAATIIALMLVTLFMSQYYRKRLSAISPLNFDVGDLVNKKQQLESDVDSIKEWIAVQNDELIRLKAEREEQELIRAELQRLEQDTNQKEEANKALRDEVGILESQRHLLVQTMEKVEAEKAEIDKAIEQLNKDRDKAAEELGELEKKLEKQREDAAAELRSIEQSIEEAKTKKAEIDEAVEQQKKWLEGLESEYEELKDKITGAKEELEKLEEKIKSSQKTLQDVKEKVDELTKEEAKLTGKVEVLAAQLKTIGQMPPEAFDSLNQAVFEKSEVVRSASSEEEALRKLYSLTKASGFELPERIQNAFHTSLKTSDISCLTVMAGVSGTGKSAFPKLYAQSMGLHFLPLAVEPRWDSPQDLLGFLNYMENRFEATTLGRSLVQFNNSPFASAHADMKDQILLVLLDEMNLARIEYYFSEFLSKLEMRRNVELSHPPDYRMVATEIYPGGRKDDKKTDPVLLYAGKNVLFVGTMNEDETTQSLSDKVIDRANVLYFGKPDRLMNKPQRVRPHQDWAPITYDNWKSWYKEPEANSIPDFDDADNLLNDINTTLADLGRPFGWRTYRAIMTYIANHPSVSLQGQGSMQPISDQVAMRVMPKLRGLDLAQYDSVFTRLRAQLNVINDAALMDAFRSASESAQGFFDWRGIRW